MTLGDFAQGKATATIAQAVLPLDMDFDPVSAIINFSVEGLSVVGDSVPLTIPLPSGVEAVQAVAPVAAVAAVEAGDGIEAVVAVEALVAIPAVIITEDAKYHKYTEAKGWFDFVEDDKNSICSALKNNSGLCPAPGSDLYTLGETSNGLVAGNTCIQLTIEDAGPNGADGLANGIAVDPGALVQDHVNLAPELTVTGLSVFGNAAVKINASASDHESDDITYTWTQKAGLSVTLTTRTSNLFFTAPSVLEDTTLIFEVLANDGTDETKELFEVLVTNNSNAPVKKDSGSLGLIGLAGLSRCKLFK